MSGYQRDRFTWTGYVLLAWFAYLQAAPGLVVPHLRLELELNYSTGGLYITAFAAGSTVAGLFFAKLEVALGRRGLLWSSAALLGVGTAGLTAARSLETSLGSVLTMGFGGGLVFAVLQAALADHQGEFQAVALTELNVAASCGYLAVVGMLSLATQLGSGWRVALLGSLLVPILVWWYSRSVPIKTTTPSHASPRNEPSNTMWVAVGIVACTTAVEWSVTAWGATFVQTTNQVSAETAVSLMVSYFGGFLAGRVLGSRLALRHTPTRLLGWALALTTLGFILVWMSIQPSQTAAGLVLLGAGVGNLFPMAVAATVAIAPDRAGQVSGHVVAASAGAVLLAPVTVGALADATGLRAALTVVPVLLATSAAGLILLRVATAAPTRS